VLSHLAEEQAVMLFNGQKGRYQPYHTSEVNKAIDNLTKALKMQLELARSLQDSHKDALQINILNQNTQENRTYVTPEEALKISENMAQKSLLEDPTQLLSVLPQSLPEVKAIKQDLSQIGIRMDTKSEPEPEEVEILE